MKIVRVTLLLLVVACSSPQRPLAETPTDTSPHATLADDDDVKPTYGKDTLEQALIAERGAEASGERRVDELEQKGDDDNWRVAVADLAVRRRFIAALELCQSSGHTCPPRLDDPPWKFDITDDKAKPPLEAPLRFDVDDWRKVAAELHGRACACRTLACLDSVGVAIDQLELRPMQDVRGDEAATASITHARECLFRLRGKTVAKPIIEPTG